LIVATGGGAPSTFGASGAPACQGFGVGKEARLAHNNGRPPAIIATMINGNAAVRGLSLAADPVALSGTFSGAGLAAGTGLAASGATAGVGNAWPQNSHAAAATSLILAQLGLGHILRCIEKPHAAQKRVPVGFSCWQNGHFMAGMICGYRV
jgi:hypothetical protein